MSLDLPPHEIESMYPCSPMQQGDHGEPTGDSRSLLPAYTQTFLLKITPPEGRAVAGAQLVETWLRMVRKLPDVANLSSWRAMRETTSRSFCITPSRWCYLRAVLARTSSEALCSSRRINCYLLLLARLLSIASSSARLRMRRFTFSSRRATFLRMA